MIDSHAHLSSKEILPQIKEVVERAHQAGVMQMVNICTDEETLEGGLKIQKEFKGIYNTAATTPHDVEKEGDSFFPIVEAHVKDLVAIGETGLDYYYEHSPKQLQRHFLSRYLDLAKRVSLPVVFHCRDAFDDLFAICDEQYRDQPAVLHCFTGSKQEAKGCLDRGWFVSFSGTITFKKSEELREVVKYVPLDRLFIETDAPYLAPQRHRGKQNEPSYLVETCEKVAEVKNLPVEKIKQATSENSSQFFALKLS